MTANEPKQYYINGSLKILPERLQQAKNLLDEYTKRYPTSSNIFISGSFLFSKEFNDIDIFVVRERGYNEVHEDNKHLIFLTEKKLSQALFQSASLISVSNFLVPNKIFKKKLSLQNLMSLYHESIIEFMQKEEKPEMTRSLIFNHALFCENKILDGKEIKETSTAITVEAIDEMLKRLCKKLFSKLYLYVELHEYIKTLNSSIANTSPNFHLIRYKNTYEELIYGRQRSAAKTG